MKIVHCVRKTEHSLSHSSVVFIASGSLLRRKTQIRYAYVSLQQARRETNSLYLEFWSRTRCHKKAGCKRNNLVTMKQYMKSYRDLSVRDTAENPQAGSFQLPVL